MCVLMNLSPFTLLLLIPLTAASVVSKVTNHWWNHCLPRRDSCPSSNLKILHCSIATVSNVICLGLLCSYKPYLTEIYFSVDYQPYFSLLHFPTLCCVLISKISLNVPFSIWWNCLDHLLPVSCLFHVWFICYDQMFDDMLSCSGQTDIVKALAPVVGKTRGSTTVATVNT